MDIQIPDAKLHGQAELFASVNKAVAPGDGMFKDTEPAHYFLVGASALAAVIEALSATRLDMQNVTRVLDYACGFGRVLRWLRAAFPDAFLLGVDANRIAVEEASALLGVETRHLDTSLAHPIDKPFDLIWVGSLITHLPEKETRRVLKYLQEHLTETGVIVFTTHGQLVEQRIETRAQTYNLDEEGVKQTVEDFCTGGYGFANYKNRSGYGVSVATPSRIMSIVETCGLQPVYFKAQGWASHQDVYGCIGK